MNSINNIYDEEPNTPTFKKGILNSQFNNVSLPINDSNNNEFINPEINTYNQNNNNNNSNKIRVMDEMKNKMKK
jgi:hypothetical protein